jgi:[ribosomal protein S18]-alanine N-acetyltransferase
LILEPRFSIRPATPSDIPAILHLERETETAAHWPEDQYRRALTAEGPERLTLLIGNDPQLTGFLVARVSGPEWELENIVIATNAQRCGLGTRLIQRLIEIAHQRAAVAIFLEVRCSNHGAQALYSTLGFKPCGLRKNYYSAPVEDAAVYRLQLERT